VPVPMIFRIFWIAPIIVGVIVSLTVAQNVMRADASAHWKPVSATLFRIGGQKRFLLSQSWGSYRWEFSGKAYEGSEINCCGGQWDEWLDQVGEKKDGETVTAYINPANPADAVLITGRSAGCLSPLLTALALVAAGFWIRKRILSDVGVDRARRGF
jgi:hypothetical protein